MGITGFHFSTEKELSPDAVMQGLRSCLTFGFGLTLDVVYEDAAEALQKIDASSDAVGHEATLQVLIKNPERFGTLKQAPCCRALPMMPPDAVRQMMVQMQMFRMLYVSLFANG